MKQKKNANIQIDDVSGEPLTQDEMRGLEERQVYHHVLRSVAQADP